MKEKLGVFSNFKDIYGIQGEDPFMDDDGAVLLHWDVHLRALRPVSMWCPLVDEVHYGPGFASLGRHLVDPGGAVEFLHDEAACVIC